MAPSSRRQFIRNSLAIGGSAFLGPHLMPGIQQMTSIAADDIPGSKMKYGLVTYLWGQDWDLPTLIANCEASGVLGVELRTTHAHGVELSLTAQERKDVKKRFDDSSVTNVGIGSNERYDSPDSAVLEKAIETTKDFLILSHDIGTSGVKVKPDRFYEDVPREKTIAQIGASLNTLGKFAAELGQEVRLEVHGQAAAPPVIRQIIDIADHPHVKVCWNSNPTDLEGEGLEFNFNILKDDFGATCHVHQFDDKSYPYAELMKLLVAMDYDGWLLLEAGDAPEDRIAGLKHQLALFHELRKQAQSS
ncbi:MAG: TIM barrel protein [Planctomycetota bacterium]|nr:TIM barrel protein [Planctomycetota bacterium]MDA1214170.1 TIM barrel protein [Planctomycetota bacterium]